MSSKIRKVAKTKEGVPKKYLPEGLSKEDRAKQLKSIQEGTKRPKVDFDSRRSSHVKKFEEKYGKKISDKKWINDNILKSKGQELIIKKGMGAYYSGGSSPNQTPQSWALARLASVIMGGKARQVDKDIWNKYKVKK